MTDGIPSTMTRRLGLAAIALTFAALGPATAPSASATDAADTSWFAPTRLLGNTTPHLVTAAEHAAVRPGMTRQRVTQLYGMRGTLSAYDPHRNPRQVRIYPCSARNGGDTYVYYELTGGKWRVLRTTWFG